MTALGLVVLAFAIVLGFLAYRLRFIHIEFGPRGGESQLRGGGDDRPEGPWQIKPAPDRKQLKGGGGVRKPRRARREM